MEPTSYSQFSPKSLVESPQIANEAQSPNNNTAPKPKKFFKSRNAAPDPNLIAALSDPQVVASMTSPSYYGTGVIPYQSQPANFYQSEAAAATMPAAAEQKSRKRKGKSDDTPKKPKAEKAPKPPKPPKPIKVKPEKAPKVEKPPKPEKVPKAVTKKKAKAAEKIAEAPRPTRVLSRARKVVNYSEDKSRSPPPSLARATTSYADDVHAAAPTAVDVNSLANESYESNEQNAMDAVVGYDGQLNDSGSSPSKNVAVPPPIVLRISKVS